MKGKVVKTEHIEHIAGNKEKPKQAEKPRLQKLLYKISDKLSEIESTLDVIDTALLGIGTEGSGNEEGRPSSIFMEAVDVLGRITTISDRLSNIEDSITDTRKGNEEA